LYYSFYWKFISDEITICYQLLIWQRKTGPSEETGSIARGKIPGKRRNGVDFTVTGALASRLGNARRTLAKLTWCLVAQVEFGRRAAASADKGISTPTTRQPVFDPMCAQDLANGLDADLVDDPFLDQIFAQSL
jgi:hypothetical protein